MSITFGGLATGIDTNSLIDQLMAAERVPITRLESDKAWMNSRLAGFQSFDVQLQGLLTDVQKISDREQYFQRSATASSDDFFSTTVSNDALAGTRYQIEVESLAQVQKSYSNAANSGFSAKDTLVFGTGNLSFTVGTETKTVTIDDNNKSLEGIAQAINDAAIGVSAAIINDGSASPYRLTLTADDVAISFSLDSSDLDGDVGVTALEGNNFTNSQLATEAQIKVDGLTITSSSNTITDAIPGVTLDLLDAAVGTTTQLTISSDTAVISQNIQDFITGYNNAISFVTSQSTMGDSDSGILSGDSGLNAVKRHLQDMLTNLSDNNGSFRALSQLGLETQKDGTLTLNAETLDAAIKTDFDSVVSLLAGEKNGDGGVGAQFKDYLESLTNSSTGLLAGRTESINSNVSRMDERIYQMELRLEKRESTIRSQFNAMEQLVSVMNSTSDYLNTQMSALENLWNYNK